jgi:hypothetical protein
MRAHGVDVPDPQPGNGGIDIQKGSSGSPKFDPSSPAFQRAEKACSAYMPGGRGAKLSQGSGGKATGPDRNSDSDRP